VNLFLFRYLFPRHRIGFVLALVLVVGAAGAYVYSTWRNRSVMADFYKPKILSVRVGGVMVYPRSNARPEVMAGLPVEVTCDAVAPGGKGDESYYVLQGEGAPVTAPGCAAKLVWNAHAGEPARLSVEYHVKDAAGGDRLVERREAVLQVVPQREFLRIHALEDDAQHRLETLTVPRAVVPYVDAALRLEGKADDYAVLFFVRKVGSLAPVLQVNVPPDNPRGFKPITAPLRRFRAWGDELIGYAAWPGGLEVRKSQQPPSIQVGNLDDTRQAFELIAGLFRAVDVPRVAEACLSLKETAGDRAVFQVKGVELETVRQLAYKGWLSEPIQVVRAEVAPQASTFEWHVE